MDGLVDDSMGRSIIIAQTIGGFDQSLTSGRYGAQV